MGLDNNVWQAFAGCLDIANEPNGRNLTNIPCRNCGNNVTVASHENRLYSVHCGNCKWVRLQRAKNPDEAAEKAVQ